jgi:hypothetical protein
MAKAIVDARTGRRLGARPNVIALPSRGRNRLSGDKIDTRLALAYWRGCRNPCASSPGLSQNKKYDGNYKDRARYHHQNFRAVEIL